MLATVGSNPTGGTQQQLLQIGMTIMMSREEFVTKATTGDYDSYKDMGVWTVEAAALVGVLAMNGADIDHARTVEALQKLALRMPGMLVMASTTKLGEVQEDYVL